MPPAAPEFTYRAFLSYSHKDRKAARIWRKRLESFRMDPDRVGQATRLGPVPSSLAPVFHDRVDFPAGAELGPATREALAQSAALVLIASPNAARSHYVNEEVRMFRHLYPDRPLVVILESPPGTNPSDCFPPALRFALDAEGQVTTQGRDVLAADPRTGADGLPGATAKVVAGLTGLERGDVLSRVDDLLRRERWWRRGMVAGVVLLLTAGAGGGWMATLAPSVDLLVAMTPKAASERIDANESRISPSVSTPTFPVPGSIQAVPTSPSVPILRTPEPSPPDPPVSPLPLPGRATPPPVVAAPELPPGYSRARPRRDRWMSLPGQAPPPPPLVASPAPPPLASTPPVPDAPGTAVLPRFDPWPPPVPSARLVLPNFPFRAPRSDVTLGDVARAINRALWSARYADHSFYGVPGGFALVARLDRIDEQGFPMPENFRFIPPESREPFSFRNCPAPPGVIGSRQQATRDRCSYWGGAESI